MCLFTDGQKRCCSRGRSDRAGWLSVAQRRRAPRCSLLGLRSGLRRRRGLRNSATYYWASTIFFFDSSILLRQQFATTILSSWPTPSGR